ncbi:MAG: hypothetical protein ABI702_11450, partial [Burkholderiales bacterium]
MADKVDVVARPATVSLSALDVLVRLLASPEYTAVRLCVPSVAKLVTSVATPDATVPVPSVVAPSLKVTVPLEFVPVMVAVSVVLCATVVGFADAVKTVVVVRAFTVWLTALEVLVRLLVSPPYTAVRLCAPAVVKVAAKVALPDAIVPVPSVVVPSLKVTVP